MFAASPELSHNSALLEEEEAAASDLSTLGDECVMLNHRPKNPETKTCILFIFQLPKGQLVVKCVRGQAIPIY